ncbi:MAG: hypothetical protein GXY47_02910 [Acidobacteria bacterium]|nr:hypothetical protein [Acidobacteriota bacterium]
MNREDIAEIGIDKAERLYVKPVSTDFNFIYRSAMEVHWNPEEKLLYSPKPREWSYFDWYKQIHSAAKDEYGIFLVITENTKWVGVTAELQSEISQFSVTNA